MKILLALTDAQIARPLQLHLEAQSRVVETVPPETATADVLQLVQAGGFDALVVDPDLPGEGGIALIRKVRARGATLPIVVLSRFGLTRHQLLCFEAGADDYLLIPFDAQVLHARIQAVARRTQRRPSDRLRWGALALDLGEGRATVDGAPLHLTTMEFRLLEALARRAGAVVARERLYDLIHSAADESCMKVLDVHVHRIRGKLKAAGLPPLIETLRDRGYRLPAPSRPAEPAQPAGMEAA